MILHALPDKEGVDADKEVVEVSILPLLRVSSAISSDDAIDFDMELGFHICLSDQAGNAVQFFIVKMAAVTKMAMITPAVRIPA